MRIIAVSSWLVLAACGGGTGPVTPDLPDPPPDIVGTYTIGWLDGAPIAKAVVYGPCEFWGAEGVDSLHVVDGFAEVRADSTVSLNFAWRRTCWVQDTLPTLVIESVSRREAEYIPPRKLPAEVILHATDVGGYDPVRADIASLGAVDIIVRHQTTDGLRTFRLGAIR